MLCANAQLFLIEKWGNIYYKIKVKKILEKYFTRNPVDCQVKPFPTPTSTSIPRYACTLFRLSLGQVYK